MVGNPYMNNALLWTGTKRIPKYFSRSEIDLILKQLALCDFYWKDRTEASFLRIRNLAIIATQYFCALRPNEVCNIKFSDLDLEKMFLRVDGKSNKKGKDRIIPIPKKLKPYLEVYFKFPYDRFWKGSPYLFPSYYNSSPHISPSRLKYIFREYCLKPLDLYEANYNSKKSAYSLYTLRHSKATHIIESMIKKSGKVDLFAVKNYLGHADIRSTIVYLHADPNYNEYLRTQIED